MAYPSRGDLSGKSGGDPLRGQHHWVPPGLDGLIGYEMGKCNQVGVAGRVSYAAPRAGGGAREGIVEQV